MALSCGSSSVLVPLLLARVADGERLIGVVPLDVVHVHPVPAAVALHRVGRPDSGQLILGERKDTELIGARGVGLCHGHTIPMGIY